jgi:hypothetical protein
MDMAQDEKVIGVIPLARTKTGMFSTKTYTLVVTDLRLIMAEATSQVMKALTEEARAAKKAEGGGFFGQWGAQIAASLHYADRYLAMDPEAIVAETPGNAVLTPSEVRGIKVERRTERNDDGPNRDYLRVTIESTSGKRVFNTDNEDPRVDEARALLATTFGTLVK